MEMIFRNIPLARSGHSDKRGDLSVGILCMIPAHSYSKVAPVHYKNTIIGVVKNLTFAGLQNGVAELRGDIVFGRNYSTIAEMAFDEVYPSISVSVTPNNKGGANPYLARLSLVNREEREFEDQQPLDLSGLRVLVKAISESEAPAKPLYFRKKHKNLLMIEDKKNNKRYEGAFIKITSKKRPGDSAFFRLDELNAIKPTGMRNIATLLCVSNVNLYPCIHYVDFLSFIAEVQRQEGKARRGKYRVYTLNIDNKEPLNGKR